MSCVLACVGFGPSECRNTQGAIQSKHSFVWIIIFNLSPSDQLHNIIGLQKKVLDNKKGTPCQKVIMRALENWKRFHNIKSEKVSQYIWHQKNVCQQNRDPVSKGYNESTWKLEKSFMICFVRRGKSLAQYFDNLFFSLQNVTLFEFKF